jgi:RNase P subunit RPR2
MKGRFNPITVDRRVRAMWFIAGFPLLFATIFVDERFKFAILGLGALLVGADLILVRCPNCGKSLRVRTVRMAGKAIPLPLGILEKTCTRCGWDARIPVAGPAAGATGR